MSQESADKPDNPSLRALAQLMAAVSDIAPPHLATAIFVQARTDPASVVRPESGTLPPPLPYERVIAWTRMMPRDEKGNYKLERFTVMDVEACISGAMKEQYEAIAALWPRSASGEGKP